uniref:Integrase, catalytic region, zinc finger, CCHC-type, peptidase aspartic, catalytic n=1 Tax=Tanacetum cinerariifolium TaxID=118510 RepID=A0A699S7N7_TANCI|nr:hypothetical protein [Tanacetum cinerariifolium]
MCKKCLNSVTHDVCLKNYVNGKKSRGRKHKATISKTETQKNYQPKASKPKKVGTRESLAKPKPRKPRLLLRWSSTGRLFDHDGKLVASSKSESHTKKVGSIERLASPKPSKPRSFLRWSPTGRLFDLKGKIIATSESESQPDCSMGDNACTFNPLEPTFKWFPNSTFSLKGHPNMFMVRRLGLFQSHDRKPKASHQFRLEVFGNCSLWK